MSAQNHNKGKSRWALLHKDTPNAMLEMVKLAEQGVEKYSRDNFTKSMGTPDAARFLEESLESIMRHTIALMNGEEIDQETGRHHGACIMRRASFSIEYWAHDKQENEIMDDDLLPPLSIVRDCTDLDAQADLAEILDIQTGEVRNKESRYDWAKAPAYATYAFTDTFDQKHFADHIPPSQIFRHIEPRPE